VQAASPSSRVGLMVEPGEPLIDVEPVEIPEDPNARLGLGFVPAGHVAARVWTNATSPGWRFPELSGPGLPGVLPSPFWVPRLTMSPDVGICLGGGGLRAAAMADGWLRGLHMVRPSGLVHCTVWGRPGCAHHGKGCAPVRRRESRDQLQALSPPPAAAPPPLQLNVAQRSRYITSNSGSSWYLGPYGYGSMPLNTFLGPYVEVGLTLGAGCPVATCPALPRALSSAGGRISARTQAVQGVCCLPRVTRSVMQRNTPQVVDAAWRPALHRLAQAKDLSLRVLKGPAPRGSFLEVLNKVNLAQIALSPCEQASRWRRHAQATGGWQPLGPAPRLHARLACAGQSSQDSGPAKPRVGARSAAAGGWAGGWLAGAAC
jgi:hypothetical protein